MIAYLKKAPDLPESTGREIQIGGPDVLSYGDMLDRMADALKTSPRPRVPVPLLTPWLSSLWIGLVTPVDAAVARPLIEGLSTPTIVTDPSAAEPTGRQDDPARSDRSGHRRRAAKRDGGACVEGLRGRSVGMNATLTKKAAVARPAAMRSAAL